MPLTKSRYDGLADWYENWNGPKAARNAEPGPCDPGQPRDPGTQEGQRSVITFAVIRAAASEAR